MQYEVTLVDQNDVDVDITGLWIHSLPLMCSAALTTPPHTDIQEEVAQRLVDRRLMGQ